MPYNKEKSLEQTISKTRKIIQNCDTDCFYTHNDLMLLIGTAIMWVSLCHIFSGFQLSNVTQRYEVELAYVNCGVAGGCGGLSTLLIVKAWQFGY